MAHAPAGPDSDRDGGHGARAALGLSRRGNPAGRRGLDSARSEALARGRAEQFDGAHRHRGTARRQGRRLDGEGQRCAVWRAAPRSGSEHDTGAKARHSQGAIGDFDPKLAELTDNVLYGDVWERPELSKRDRSLVTLAALIALNRPDQLRSHLVRARENGVTQRELIETITHLAFYAGWPNAVNAIAVAKGVFEKK
jgi:4-carboxymuconolactone decarboxylase